MDINLLIVVSAYGGYIYIYIYIYVCVCVCVCVNGVKIYILLLPYLNFLNKCNNHAFRIFK